MTPNSFFPIPGKFDDDERVLIFAFLGFLYLSVFANLFNLGGVFLGDLPQDVTEQQIIDAFSPFGPVERVDIKVDKRTQCRLSYGFAYFVKAETVDSIIKQHDCIV